MTARPSLTLWEGSIAAAGLLSIAFTFHTYRFWNSSGRAAPRTTFSAAEASLRVESDKAVLSARPDDLDALTDLAIAYYQKGRDSYVDGVNALEKARSLGATNEALFFYAGVMYDALGLPDYAANEFAKYLRHYPNDYETMVRLANTEVEQAKYDDALALYGQALKYWPKDPTAWFNFAVVNIKKGNSDAATSALARVKELAGALPEGGAFEEGEIARLKGSDDAAIALYQQELTRDPNYLAALEALEAAQKRKSLFKDAQLTHKRIQEIKHNALVKITAPAAVPVVPPVVAPVIMHVAAPAPVHVVVPAPAAAVAPEVVPTATVAPVQTAPVVNDGQKS